MLLINPPSSFLIDERVFPSLGVLRVAAALEAAGREAEVLDLAGDKHGHKLAARLGHDRPEAVGISATTPQMPSVTEMLPAIRSAWPGVRVVLGGPHGTLTLAAEKQEARRGAPGRAHRAAQRLRRDFDVVVAGEGESAVLAALRPDAPAVVDADDRRSPYWQRDADYEAAPWPARNKIDLRSYHYEIDGNDATSLIAQLGCPMACTFCGGRNSPSLRFIRTRSTENIVAEVEFLYREYGYAAAMFYDDEMNVNPGLVGLCDALCGLQDRLGVEMRFRGFIKAELFTSEQAAAMYRAGFRWLLCGFEAADDRILTNIQKRATLGDNTRAVEMAKAAGMKVKALMSVGHAGETPETVEAVGNWLKIVEADDFDCTVITPYPGTPYYDESVWEDHEHRWVYTSPVTGDRLYSEEVDYSRQADYYKGVPGAYVSHVWTDALSREKLVAARDALEADVRAKLGLTYPVATAAKDYEHSMGQR